MKSLKPAMNITTRTALAHDGEFIYDITKLTMAKYAIAAWGEFAESEVRATSFTYAQTGAAEIIFDGQCPIGVFTLNEFKDRVVIVQLYLMPAYQRLGIGSVRVRQLIQHTPEDKAIELDVFKQNTAVAFYRKLGFVIKREHTHHYTMRLNRHWAAAIHLAGIYKFCGHLACG